jgi:hypothetical protein
LADQAVAGWQEAGATVNALNELNPNGSLTIGGGQTRTLGMPFNPVIPAEFGVSPEDIVFQYGKTTGEKFNGVVEYLGTRDTNNFRLTINPATGQAQLRNDGGIPIALEGYSILSESGSLLSSWNSLDDQNVGGVNVWQEAGPTATALSELNPLASTTIGPNAGYPLGALWNTGGLRDLQLKFQLANESTSRIGAVVYGLLPPLSSGGLTGDFDNDGDVDGRDFLVWQRGASPDPLSASDLAAWQGNYGAGSLAASTAVPEPASLISVLIAGIGSLAGRRRLV